MKTFKIKDETILRKLEGKYDVNDVQYNILTSNFVYYKNGEKKHISLKSLVNHLKHEENKDIEFFEMLDQLHSSYFDIRMKEYFEEFYKSHNLPIPRDIFITRGFIEFYDKEHNVFYLPYDDDLDEVFKQANKFIK